MWAELLQALRDFLVRDLLYVVGGASVCLAGLYAFDRVPTTEVSGVWMVVGAGISYGIGLAVQETAALFRLVRVSPLLSPNSLCRFLYRRMTGTEWLPVTEQMWLQKLKDIKQNTSSRVWAQLQRTISLKHVGITLGSNWLLASALLWARWIWRGRELPNLALAVSSLLVACALLIVAISKNAQQVQYVCHSKEI